MATFAPRFTCRETAASLTSRNPIPYDGEICCESDTGKIKIGDGRTAWNSLSYAGDGTGESPTVKQVSSDVQSVESDVVTISDLTTSLSANTTYAISGTFVFEGSSLRPAINVTGPSGATGYFGLVCLQPSIGMVCTVNGGEGLATSDLTGVNAVSAYGFVTTSSTAGNLTFVLRESLGDAAGLYVKAGTFLTFTAL